MAKFFTGTSNTPHPVELRLEGEELIVLGEPLVHFPLKKVVVSHLSPTEIHLRLGMTFLELSSEDALFSELHRKLSHSSRRAVRKTVTASFGVLLFLFLFFTSLELLIPVMPDRFFTWVLPGDEYQEMFKACMIPDETVQSILEKAELKRPYKIGVIKLGLKNAFAFPMDKIFMTRDLLNAMKTDDELMALLGHELGHLEEDHYKPAVLRFFFMNILVTFFTDSGTGALHSVFMNMYSRDQERAADMSSAVFLKKTGHSYRGGMELMSNLETEQMGFIPSFLSTHPDLASRKLFYEELLVAGPVASIPTTELLELFKKNCP